MRTNETGSIHFGPQILQVRVPSPIAIEINFQASGFRISGGAYPTSSNDSDFAMANGLLDRSRTVERIHFAMATTQSQYGLPVFQHDSLDPVVQHSFELDLSTSPSTVVRIDKVELLCSPLNYAVCGVVISAAHGRTTGRAVPSGACSPSRLQVPRGLRLSASGNWRDDIKSRISSDFVIYVVLPAILLAIAAAPLLSCYLRCQARRRYRAAHATGPNPEAIELVAREHDATSSS